LAFYLSAASRLRSHVLFLGLDRTRIGRVQRNRAFSMLHVPVSARADRRDRPDPAKLLFVEVYAFVFIGLWFLLPAVLQSLLPSSSGDVAWWAHVGGFLAGFTLGPLLVRSRERYRVYYPDEGMLGFDTDGRI
jgi:membrane associated rhomboid family serine protease